MVLSPCRPGIYITFLADGYCAGSVLTSQLAQYHALAADWKATCQSPHPPLALSPVATHHPSSSASNTSPVAFHQQTSAASVSRPVAVQHRPTSAVVPHPASTHHRSSSASFSDGLSQGLKALKLANGLMNAVNGNGGQSYDSTDFSSDISFDNNVVDTSDSWQPVESVASDPIQ